MRLAFLQSPPAQQALERLGKQNLSQPATLAILGQLRRQFSPEEAGWLLSLARLRQKAAAKFSQAGQMFFSAEALEQASAEVISRYRARRYAGRNYVLDLGCGIGGDTLALAQTGAAVIAIDLDHERVRMACLNAAVYKVGERVAGLCTDWTQQPLRADAAFADPGRRIDGKRIFSVEHYQPPLSQAVALRGRVNGLGIKISPGVDYTELPTGAEVEFISVQGELREAVLWLGDLRSAAHRRATVLREGAEYSLATDRPEPVATTGRPAVYLYEPDPAVMRGRLIGLLAAQHDWHLLDPEIAYLSGDTLIQTPFAQPFQVLEHAPFNLKALNRRLRALGAGPAVVKKRGLGIDPDEFGRRLVHTPGGWEVTVFVTRLANKPWMLITRRVWK